MLVNEEMKKRVETKLHESIKLAEAHFNQSFPFPNLEYTKSGATAGTAQYNTYTLNFNPILLIENDDLFIQRTVPHEMAHLITHTLYPDVSAHHGKDWKYVMRVLQVADSNRCHTYDVTNSKRHQNKHQYSCDGCSKVFTALSTKRHNELVKNPNRYCCSVCRGALSYDFSHKRGVKVHTGLINKQTKAPPTPRQGTKAARAYSLFVKYHKGFYNWNRHDIIVQFCEDLDMTWAGASTYYSNCKKRFDEI